MTPGTVTVRKDDLRLLMEQAADAPRAIGQLGKPLSAAAEAALNQALARCGEALAGAGSGTEEESAPATVPVHPGEWARVDIMGHDWRIGWVSDGSMAGAACLDVRDGSGRVVAKIPPHSVYLYSPLPPPQPGEAPLAIARVTVHDEDPDDAWADDEGGEGY
jgi:hypothetical protein